MLLPASLEMLDFFSSNNATGHRFQTLMELTCPDHASNEQLLDLSRISAAPLGMLRSPKQAYLRADAWVLHVFLQSCRIALGLLQDGLHDWVLQDTHDLLNIALTFDPKACDARD